jgi:hypothetical protein
MRSGKPESGKLRRPAFRMRFVARGSDGSAAQLVGTSGNAISGIHLFILLTSRPKVNAAAGRRHIMARGLRLVQPYPDIHLSIKGTFTRLACALVNAGLDPAGLVTCGCPQLAKRTLHAFGAASLATDLLGLESERRDAAGHLVHDEWPRQRRSCSLRTSDPFAQAAVDADRRRVRPRQIATSRIDESRI